MIDIYLVVGEKVVVWEVLFALDILDILLGIFDFCFFDYIHFDIGYFDYEYNFVQFLFLFLDKIDFALEDNFLYYY